MTNETPDIRDGEGSRIACDAKMSIRRAGTHEEIQPLVELCKAGRLFEVQEWIAAGRPVNPPSPPQKGNRRKSPFEIAMDLGFHSLVQVLLEGGATPESEGCNCPLYDAISMRRLDLIQLLARHGYDPQSVDMVSVFHSWDPEIMEFFIENGADLEAGNPLAHALCDRIRTALRILKKYRNRFPSLDEQANVALRCHCKEGNLKWVSLMLWGGADPYKPGPRGFSRLLPKRFDTFRLRKNAGRSRAGVFS